VAKSKANKSSKPAKATKAAKRSSKERANDKPQPLEATRSVVPEEPAPRIAGEISSAEIGHVAGDVWGILDRFGELTLAELKKEVPAPADIVLAAIGWLAREDKLEFASSGRKLKVSLRK
jgi:hypothetical protein